MLHWTLVKLKIKLDKERKLELEGSEQQAELEEKYWLKVKDTNLSCKVKMKDCNGGKTESSFATANNKI